MRNPQIPTSLKDRSGHVWASGEFSIPNIRRTIKELHAAGIEVTAYVMGAN